jgi:hypothetical protein
MNTFILTIPRLDYHILLPLNKSIISLSDYIRRFRDTRNWCFNLNIFYKNLADLAYSELLPHLKEKLESHIFFYVSQVLQWALDCER